MNKSVKSIKIQPGKKSANLGRNLLWYKRKQNYRTKRQSHDACIIKKLIMIGTDTFTLRRGFPEKHKQNSHGNLSEWQISGTNEHGYENLSFISKTLKSSNATRALFHLANNPVFWNIL